MLAQNYCEKVKLHSFKEFQLVRERFLGDLENSLRSLPSVVDISDNKIHFKDRLDGLCTLLKEKYEFEGELILEYEDFDGPETDKMTPEEREEFTTKMVNEHGIVYDWIIRCNYNRYNGFSEDFKAIEQILSFWTQRDFAGSFTQYVAMSEHNEVEIHVWLLPQISVSRESVQDWTM